MSLKESITETLHRDEATASPRQLVQSETISIKQAVTTAGLCAIAGATATIPLYATFWWWDLLAHALSGGAIAATGRLLRFTHSAAISVVVVTAVGWEFIEPKLPTESLGITFATGDAPSDIVATLVGGVVVIAMLQIQVLSGRR